MYVEWLLPVRIADLRGTYGEGLARAETSHSRLGKQASQYRPDSRRSPACKTLATCDPERRDPAANGIAPSRCQKPGGAARAAMASMSAVGDVCLRKSDSAGASFPRKFLKDSEIQA